MNILITHYLIQDYGGLVNDTEIMTEGFKRLGHTVDNILLTPKDYGFKKGRGENFIPKTDEYEVGIGTGLFMHHKLGWRGMDLFGFSDKRKIGQWRDLVSKYDLIIHQNPVPTLRKDYKGVGTWKDLYNVKIPQLVICPDANFRDSYPHLYEVIEYISGVVCTHEASYKACELLPVPRILLAGPHIVNKFTPRDFRFTVDRMKGFMSVQNFKPIKRMQDVIGMIPFLPKKFIKYIAGGGIEYHYMTSKTKVKPVYMASNGKSIWQNAIDNDMKFLGYISNGERDLLMNGIRIHLDCSWSSKYTALGPHFNRTFIEAMNTGCVPVCTDLGMGGSLVFKPGVNYVEIPAKIGNEERAYIVKEIIDNDSLLGKIRKENAKILDKFCHLEVCRQIIELGKGKKAVGLLGPKVKGRFDSSLDELSSKAYKEFFNA